jgi:peptidyl-prolyl cis-trans isomerase SurA
MSFMKIPFVPRGLGAVSVVGLAALMIASSALAQSLDPNRSRNGRTGLQRPTTPKPADPASTPTPGPAPVATSVPPGDRSQTLDSIVAVVNTEVITRLELDDRVATTVRNMSQQGVQLPPRSVIERQVLDRMIVERSEVQVAVDNGVRVDDLQLDRAVQRVAEQNNMTVQVFRDRLEASGTPFASFRDDLRTQIMIERARAHEVDDKVQVGEGEIDAYLAQNGASADSPTEIDIAQILVRVPESATPDQVEKQKAKADDIYQRAKKGENFGQLAATFSEAPEALQGGDLGFRSQERLPQLFIDAINPLAIGDVAAPVRSGNGFHILKVVARRKEGGNANLTAAQSTQVEQTHARHILIKVNEVVSAEQAKARLDEIRQRLINKTASFEDMARAYSNDTSASRGGDLGTLYPGDTVPEFEKAMNALAPGEISEPIQSTFGFHLIQVIERKRQDVAQDRLRLIARQAIRERKIEEASDAWARELRDRAYVEMRLDDK